MRIKLIVTIATLSIAIVGTGLWTQTSIFKQSVKENGELYIIEIKEDGFDPAEITIRKGDSVKFVNKAHEFAWPASDPHPTHEFLSGFDPGTAVAQNDSWIYTFNEPGSWNYHDHVNVSFKGTINVLNSDSEKVESVSAEDCEALAESQKEACWYEAIKLKAKDESIDEAFSLFTKVYATGAPLGCHWTAHLIGEEAYKKFIQGEKFKITQATSYCGYGFYHGFMEPLLRANPDMDLALEFCEEVEEQLGREGRSNCYHGIGHGFSEDPPPASTWGDGNLMARPGLSVCEDLFEDLHNIYLEICATGVYTVVAHFMEDNLYGVSMDSSDPFAFCRTQPKKYEVACYGEFAPKLDLITDWDPSKIPPFLDGIETPRTKEMTIRGAVSAMMQRDVTKDEHSNYINGCRTFPKELQITCLKGVIWGFMMHGVPEQEYKKLLNFCSSALNNEERDFCYTEAFSRFKAVYNIEKYQTICKLDPKYKPYCAEEEI